MTLTLEYLPPGTRFALADLPTYTGTLIRVGDGSATVELDGRATVRDFETADHKWVRICDNGRRRTTIAKTAEVKPL